MDHGPDKDRQLGCVFHARASCSLIYSQDSQASYLEALHMLLRLKIGRQGLYECGVRLPHSASVRRYSPHEWRYQQGARSMPPSDDGHGRPPGPHVDERKVRPNLCTWKAGVKVRTREAGTMDSGVQLGGQGPLAWSPRLEMSPIPSCP